MKIWLEENLVFIGISNKKCQLNTLTKIETIHIDRQTPTESIVTDEDEKSFLDGEEEEGEDEMSES